MGLGPFILTLDAVSVRATCGVLPRLEAFERRAAAPFTVRSVGIGESSPTSSYYEIYRREIEVKGQGVYNLALLAT